jgi:hypothetical protein
VRSLNAQARECTGALVPFSRSVASPPIFLDAVQLADRNGTLVAVGDPSLEMMPDSVGQARLLGAVTWNNAGSRKLLEPPVGKPAAIYPRVAVTSGGVLHFVYGTIQDLKSRNAFTRPDTLWHIEYSPRGWRAPTPIPTVDAKTVWWEHLSSSSLISNATALEIALAMRRRDSVTILFLHRDADGAWRQTPIATGGDLALGVRLVRVGNSLVLSYAGPDPAATSSDRGSIFVIRSENDGETWTPPIRVFASGARDTYDHALLANVSGELFLVWRQQNASGARLSDTAAVFASRDTGRTWNARPALAIPTGFTRLQAATTSQGLVLLFAEISRGNRAAILRGDEWNPVSLPPSFADLSGIALHAMHDGAIALVGTRSGSSADTPSRQIIPSTDAYRLTISCRIARREALRRAWDERFMKEELPGVFPTGYPNGSGQLAFRIPSQQSPLIRGLEPVRDATTSRP